MEEKAKKGQHFELTKKSSTTSTKSKLILEKILRGNMDAVTSAASQLIMLMSAGFVKMEMVTKTIIITITTTRTATTTTIIVIKHK